MVDDFMSSEESSGEDFVVRPLKWRSLKVDDFFARLDATAQSRRSSQSRKMRNQRQAGEMPSQRPCPIANYSNTLLWAFKREYHPAPSPTCSSTPSHR
jgi:hypothetical protein